ncbi:MAG: hypoxanthine phosphoribosyltransferase [Planctomycetota bacterium]
MHAGREVTFVVVMRGGMVFAADLVRRVDLPIRLDYVVASSYGAGTEPGAVRVTGGLELDFERQDVLLVDDILDTGCTMKTIRDQLLAFDPRSVRIATLLDKPSRRRVPMKADFVGFEVGDVFVIGYGLDYDQRFRNLPYIAELDGK